VTPIPTQQSPAVVPPVSEATPPKSLDSAISSSPPSGLDRLINGERPKGGIERVAYDIITGIKVIGELLAPSNKEQRNELKSDLREEFPGLKPEFIKIVDYGKVSETPETMRRLERGGVSIHVPVLPGLLEITGPNLVTDIDERSILLHEMAHTADHSIGGNFPTISQTPGFKQATQDVRSMYERRHGYINEPYYPMIELVWNFPGIGGNEKLTDYHNWGGPIELYATIFGYAKGYLDNIPPPMRPYYERWMEFAPPQGEGRVPPK
jgi:hypothetical protein